MKIMTFNIQSCKDYVKQEFNYQICGNLIKEINPDVLGLNEVTNGYVPENGPRYIKQVDTLKDYCGYQYAYFGEAIKIHDIAPYGNAVLSKYPFNDIKTIKIKDPERTEDCYYESRAIITCEINGIVFIITHMGLANGERINAVKEIIDLTKKESRPIILMGDFNMEPDNDIIKPLYDYYNDTTCLIKGNIKTFPSINPKTKIDYIMIKKDANIEIKSIKVIEKVASDHFPLLLEIK